MLTIGEFSRLSHISARMLRHYDAIGLLRPAHTGGSNGYRYYDAAQLPVLLRIEELKDYGFLLNEIRELLTLPQEEQAQRIHSRRIKAYEELNEMRKSIRQMEENIIKMEGLAMSQTTNEKYKVVVMNSPSQTVFGIRRKINIGQIHDLFQELLSEAEKLGLKRAGATQLLYHGEEFSYDNMDVEAQVQVLGSGTDVKEIPPMLCASTIHIGPYDTVKFAYDAICTFMAAHPEYKVCGPAIERYIKDEDSVKSPEELETGIIFPIEQV